MVAPRPITTAPWVTPILQVAVGQDEVSVGQGRYDTSRYNQGPDATYSGFDALFDDDFTCTVVEASTYNGRERSHDRFDVGTATFTVYNDGGMWDYPPATGSTQPLTVRPGRQIRVGVRFNAPIADPDPVWLWRGWIDATRPEYRPGVGDVVTVDCVDAKGEAGRVEVARTGTPVGVGETVTARMERLAFGAGFPGHRWLFEPTGITLQGSTLGTRTANLMDSAADAGGGAVYGDRLGYLVYRHRDWLSWYPGTPPDFYIGNRPGDQACPQGWEQSFARSDFATRIVYGVAGQEPRPPLNDTANQGIYGVETYTLASLENAVAADADDIAQRAYRARNFDRAPRIAAVTLTAGHNPINAVVMSELNPFTPTLVSAGLLEDDGRSVFSRMLFVTAVEHTITANEWTARVALDDADPYWQTTDARYDAAHYNADIYAHSV